MTTRFGDFQAPQFNCVGDRYSDREKPGERDQGLSFKATAARKGKNNDATFDKFKALCEGEKYVDPSRQRLLALKEKRRGAVAETPFKGPSPMKESCGAGDFYGTLQGKVDYIAGSPEVKLKKGGVPSEQRNIYTSPSKHGTYGCNKTTLSERQGARGVCGEYEYQPEPYDRARQLANAEKAATKNVSDAAFRPAGPGKRGSYGYAKTNIGNKAAGIAGEFAYLPQGSGSATSGSTKAGGDGDAAEQPRAPFVPSRVPRKGYNCTLTKFPEYYAECDQIRADAQRQAKKLEHEALAGNAAFRPAHIPRTAATRSIVRMNM